MPESPATYASLDPCVHCGFCLPACPTYLATGDENDSPRGRIVLIRAMERGEIPASDPSLRQHLDACLGCQGCEPVCPSGVGYGRGLETARRHLASANGIGLPAGAALAVFGHRPAWRLAFGAARLLRNIGAASALAGGSRFGMMMGMVAATAPSTWSRTHRSHAPSTVTKGPTVALFRGCVMDVLFDHVHDATRRVLEANGYRVLSVNGQVCCGAPHDHSGDGAGAQRLAARNLAAFVDPADFVVVDSAGCGAALKDYGHLLGTAEADAFSSRVRDVSQLLAAAGPRHGAPLPLDVGYDAPCHLQHAQRVHAEALAVLAAIPELRVQLLPGHDRCCGGAGIHGMLHPELSGAVLDDKVTTILSADPLPAVVATGNPGCIMQIGAGLRAAGHALPVVHPVELLDESYRRAGYYPS